MSPVETKIIDTLLRYTRRQDCAVDAEVEPGFGVATKIASKSARRREAQFSDFEGIVALKQRLGLSPDSRENWKRLWESNPALSRASTALPIGWVKEADGQIVGYMGSIPLLYQYSDATLLAATTTCYAVDPAYRASSLGLVESFFRQRGCDLYLDTTATPAAGKIVRAFKAVQLPQQDYEMVLFWIFNTSAFLDAAMQKLKVARNLAKIAACLGSPALKSDIFFRRRLPGLGALRLSCRTLRVEEIGDDFQDLWLRKIQERPRLLACRTPEILRWHYLIPHSKKRPHVLACYQQGRLQGYAIVQTELVGPFGLRKTIIADLMVAGGHAEVIRELIAGACEIAKTERNDILEILGFPEEVRRECRVWNPYSRRYPACPFFFKTDQHALGEFLAHEDSWYAGPFDGDTTLSP